MGGGPVRRLSVVTSVAAAVLTLTLPVHAEPPPYDGDATHTSGGGDLLSPASAATALGSAEKATGDVSAVVSATDRGPLPTGAGMIIDGNAYLVGQSLAGATSTVTRHITVTTGTYAITAVFEQLAADASVERRGASEAGASARALSSAYFSCTSRCPAGLTNVVTASRDLACAGSRPACAMQTRVELTSVVAVEGTGTLTITAGTAADAFAGGDSDARATVSGTVVDITVTPDA